MRVAGGHGHAPAIPGAAAGSTGARPVARAAARRPLAPPRTARPAADPVPADLAAAHEAPDGRHQLVALVLAVIGRLGAHDAVLGVLVEQPEGDLVQRGLHGADLGQDVDAVAVGLDHALDAAHLALDAPQALEELVLGGAVPARGGGLGHTGRIPPRGTAGQASRRRAGAWVGCGACPPRRNRSSTATTTP